MKKNIKQEFLLAAVLIPVLLIMAALLFYRVTSIKKEDGSSTYQAKNNSNIKKSPINSKNNQNENTNNQAKSVSPTVAFKEHSSERYGYSLNFPDSWYVDSSLSSSSLEVSDLGEVGKVVAGGQTFWSNYTNIDDFSPENKPDDFHLLGLTIYQTEGETEASLMAKLGFVSDIIIRKQEFVANGVPGMQYIAAGLDEKNPLVAIVFTKNRQFYVFNLGFINGDTQAAETMENIVKTLVFK